MVHLDIQCGVVVHMKLILNQLYFDLDNYAEVVNAAIGDTLRW
jgi:hypothetical protein